MNLSAYLDRIGYQGSVRPDLDCLRRIHTHQALSIPYENIDVQLGKPLDQNVETIFRKIVEGGRGGWCFELNGLLGWALQEIGFDVMRVCAGIYRNERGDAAFGNHLVLLVRLDEMFLCDHGMGDGLREPIPLVCGLHKQGNLTFQLEQTHDGYWRFLNHASAVPENFDFRAEPADEEVLAAKCASLQVSPESTFVQNLICQLMGSEDIVCLTGRVLRHKSREGTTKSLLQSVDELYRALAETYGIKNVDVATLWAKAVRRHDERFGTRSIEEIVVDGMF